MVKHSSDGMKITINKTKSKEKLSSGLTKSASFNSGSNSPKTHTGLKPGVNSGPASKKPSLSSSGKSSSSGQKMPFQKSSSSGNLSSGGSGKIYSPSKSGSGGSSNSGTKEKIKSSKTSSGSSDKYRADPNDIMKMLGFPSSMQGTDNFMKSSKFQIPKISARSNMNQSNPGSIPDDYRKEKASLSAPNTPSTSSNSIDTSPRMLPDFAKYPMTFSAATKLPGDISPMHIPSATSTFNKISIGNSPKYNTQADTREAMNLETYHSNKLNSMPLSFSSPLHHNSIESGLDKILDNNGGGGGGTGVAMLGAAVKQRSNTPSHSVHATVVKSPSPLIVIPSPRSNDNITDEDNLMEELVGITKWRNFITLDVKLGSNGVSPFDCLLFVMRLF